MGWQLRGVAGLSDRGVVVIIAQIIEATRYPDGTTSSTTYALTSDVGYSTDVTDDLCARVLMMRAADEVWAEEHADETEETPDA